MRHSSPALLLCLALFAACRAPLADPASIPDDTDDTDQPPTVIDPNEDFSGLDELPCAAAEQCAPAGEEWLGTTCCAFGDNLELEGFAYLNETVDVAATSDWIVGCSGFGAAFAFHGGDASDIALTNLPNPRCQRITFGPEIGDSQVVYLAHHGDGWIPNPALWSVLLHRDGTFTTIGEQQSGPLFEGMAYNDGTLWVTTHDGGLRAFSIDAAGAPTFIYNLDGFDNAVDVMVSGSHGYVLDDERLHVIELSDPTAPVRVATFDLLDRGRDLDVVGDLLYVAEGTAGVEVIDISAPTAPVSLELIRLDGSVQSVKANETLIATSNWTHVSILDATSRARIGTERLIRSFEQDLGVAITEDLVFVGEWGGISALRYRPGYVAPDIWIDEEIFTVPAESASSVEVIVKNRGPLALTIDRVETDAPFSTTFDVTRIGAGEQVTLMLDYTPPSVSGVQELAIYSNDPDGLQDPLVIQTIANSTGGLDVGDPVPLEMLAFLAQGGDPEELRGQVLVLAYFALF